MIPRVRIANWYGIVATVLVAFSCSSVALAGNDKGVGPRWTPDSTPPVAPPGFFDPPGLGKPNFSAPLTFESHIPETPPQAARQGEYVFYRGKTGNRGGRGFEQRVLHSKHDFDYHISLDPPHRPASP